jgi:hypothetical protein
MDIRSCAAATAVLLLSGSALAEQVKLDDRPLISVAGKLKPGQYVWAPERAPSGPALVVVNLHTQRLVLFRNGVPIAADRRVHDPAEE